MASENAVLHEKLAEAVRNYPCLYDKSSDDFKDTNKKNLCWKDVAEAVGVSTGDEAKTLFTNLRNKYTRDKKKIEGKKVSGAGTDEVTQAVKEASEIYPFMKWLEPYIKPRKTVSNYKPVGVEEEFNDDTEEESRPITPTASETDSDAPSNSSSTSRGLSNVYTSGSGKKRKQTSTQAIEETEMGLMKSLEESMKRRAACQTVQQDDEDLFARLLASQLRQLPEHQKIMVEMEINSIIYRSLLSLSSHGGASQHIAQHNMASDGIAGQGISNQGMLLYQGIEEGGSQYPPGYFFNNRRQ